MVYEYQLTSLLDSWREREKGMGDHAPLALRECISDLQNLLDDNHDSEASALWIP